jgi:hypothetical protein
MISNQQRLEFENAHKSSEIPLNGDEVKPSSVKQRQILREKVQDDEKGPDEVTRQLKLYFF